MLVQLRVSCKILHRIVMPVLRVIAVRSPLPIANGILMRVEAEKLCFTGSNADVFVQTTFTKMHEMDFFSGGKKKSSKPEITFDIGKTGQVILPGRIFGNVVRKINEGDMLISMDDNWGVVLKVDSSLTFQLAGSDPIEYPTVPSVPKEDCFILDVKLLHNMFKNTVFAASSMESRGVLTGVRLCMEKGFLSAVATNTFRLSSYKIFVPEMEGISFPEAVVPAKSILELIKTLDSDGKVKCFFFEGRFHVLKHDWWFATRLLDGVYPDISSVIPHTAQVRLFVAKILLLNAVEVAALMTRDQPDQLIEFSISENKLTVGSSVKGVGSVSNTLDVSTEGGGMDLAFNSRYLSDALSALMSDDGDDLEIIFPGPRSPCRMKIVGSERVLQLVVPVINTSR